MSLFFSLLVLLQLLPICILILQSEIYSDTISLCWLQLQIAFQKSLQTLSIILGFIPNSWFALHLWWRLKLRHFDSIYWKRGLFFYRSFKGLMIGLRYFWYQFDIVFIDFNSGCLIITIILLIIWLIWYDLAYCAHNL